MSFLVFMGGCVFGMGLGVILMALPYDIARCTGTTHPICGTCRRREPGRAEWQTMIAPSKYVTTHCKNHIAPELITVAGDTEARQ